MTYANMEKLSPRTPNISQKGYCPAKFTSFLAIYFHSQSLKNRNCPEVYHHLLKFPCRISVRNVQGKHEAVQCGLWNLFRSKISSKIQCDLVLHRILEHSFFFQLLIKEQKLPGLLYQC